MINSHVYHDLEELSDDIGPRLTGSPQAAKAIEWALEKMRAKGLTSVHAETWQLTRGWRRGSAAGEIIEPIHRALAIGSMGWVGSLLLAFQRLERQGLIEGAWRISEHNRRAKFYSLTPKGTKRLPDARRDWSRRTAAIARLLEA
jgi:hypothetical protein